MKSSRRADGKQHSKNTMTVFTRCCPFGPIRGPNMKELTNAKYKYRPGTLRMRVEGANSDERRGGHELKARNPVDKEG